MTATQWRGDAVTPKMPRQKDDRQMGTLAQELAERIVAMRYESLPQEALRWSKVAFMDTNFGTMTKPLHVGHCATAGS